MKYLKVFVDFEDKIKLLGDAERGRLFTAMLEYAKTGTEPDLRGNEKFVWGTAKSEIDRQVESYEKVCVINKRIATERYGALRSVTERGKNKTKTKNKSKKSLIHLLTKMLVRQEPDAMMFRPSWKRGTVWD